MMASGTMPLELHGRSSRVHVGMHTHTHTHTHTLPVSRLGRGLGWALPALGSPRQHPAPCQFGHTEAMFGRLSRLSPHAASGGSLSGLCFCARAPSSCTEPKST